MPEHYRTITPEIVNEVLRVAKNNHNWGYQRIQNMMKYLGFKISTSTVRRILDEHGIKLVGMQNLSSEIFNNPKSRAE